MARDFTKVCFVIMPFGVKPVGGRDVNFDNMRLGILLRDQGDLPEAVAEFTAARTLQPTYSDAWREKGINEARRTKNAQGEDSIRKAIKLNPNDFDALASLGGILRKTAASKKPPNRNRRLSRTSSDY